MPKPPNLKGAREMALAYEAKHGVRQERIPPSALEDKELYQKYLTVSSKVISPRKFARLLGVMDKDVFVPKKKTREKPIEALVPFGKLPKEAFVFGIKDWISLEWFDANAYKWFAKNGDRRNTYVKRLIEIVDNPELMDYFHEMRSQNYSARQAAILTIQIKTRWPSERKIRPMRPYRRR